MNYWMLMPTRLSARNNNQAENTEKGHVEIIVSPHDAVSLFILVDFFVNQNRKDFFHEKYPPECTVTT